MTDTCPAHVERHYGQWQRGTLVSQRSLQPPRAATSLVRTRGRDRHRGRGRAGLEQRAGVGGMLDLQPLSARSYLQRTFLDALAVQP